MARIFLAVALLFLVANSVALTTMASPSPSIGEPMTSAEASEVYGGCVQFSDLVPGCGGVHIFFGGRGLALDMWTINDPKGYKLLAHPCGCGGMYDCLGNTCNGPTGA